MYWVYIAARLVVIALVVMPVTNAFASSDAGIEIDIGKFRLNIFYSDAVDYYGGADKAIREPRSTLFDVASFVQPNADSLASVDHTMQVELYTRVGSGNYLRITEDPQAQSVVLRDGSIGSDISKEILTAICDRYAGACKRPAARSINLYRCEETNCPGQIQFGAFPSNSVNKRYGLIPPKDRRAPHVRVMRDEIGRYFEKLAP